MCITKRLVLCCAALLLAGCGGDVPTETVSMSAKVSTRKVTVIDLGVVGYALDISPRGEVTGYADFGPGDARAFLWSNGQLTYLDPRGNDSRALAISPAGRVAGYRGTPSHAVVWERGAVTDLGTLPGGDYSLANGINPKGQVVGRSSHPDGWEHAFVWEKGVMTDLGSLPGFPGTDAFDINPAGQIVGGATNGDDQRAFLWEKGVMTDLGTLTGDSWAVALAINPAGQIVGWSAPYGGSPVRAFLWEKGVMTNLGTLSGDSESLAWDINSAGQVVGYSYGESGGGHAVLWDRGVMHNLGTIAGGRNSVASGINDRGEVVGFSGTADPEAFHAALWRVR